MIAIELAYTDGLTIEAGRSVFAVKRNTVESTSWSNVPGSSLDQQ